MPSDFSGAPRFPTPSGGAPECIPDPPSAPGDVFVPLMIVCSIFGPQQAISARVSHYRKSKTDLPMFFFLEKTTGEDGTERVGDVSHKKNYGEKD